MKGSVKLGIFGLLISMSQLAFASYYDFTDETDLNYEKFVDLVEEHQLQTVESTLASLKTYYPGHFETYILMYKSRSLQESSFMAPRAILFDRSAKFVFSFNGDPAHRGYNRIEIMQYRDETARFEFREVIFQQGQPPQFSEANPRKCMVCHQATNRKNIDPRPNWEPYNTWPGAYGSLNGNLDLSTHDRNQMKQRGAHPSVVEDAELEQEKASQFFQQVQPSHSRYQFLDAQKFDPHMTTEFTQFTGNLNARRISRIVTDTMPEVYQFLRRPFLVLLKCRKLAVGEDYLRWTVEELTRQGIDIPRLSMRKPKTSHELRQLAIANLHRRGGWEYTDQELEAELKIVTERNDRIFRNSPTVEVSDGLTALFEPLGISTSDWSMDFQTYGTLAFRERFGVPSNTRQTLREGFVAWKGREALNPANLNCDEMAQLASEDTQRFKQSAVYGELIAKKAEQRLMTSSDLMRRCVKCHTDYDPEIPYIPFDRESEVSNLLNQPAKLNPNRTLLEDIVYRLGDVATEKERMPMGPIYDKKLRMELARYFESLAPKDSELTETNP
jgi:hypothetical protein